MYKFVENWYMVPDTMPEDDELCYIRLPNNSYNPIYCRYSAIVNRFSVIATGTSLAMTEVLQWARLYPET